MQPRNTRHNSLHLPRGGYSGLTFCVEGYNTQGRFFVMADLDIFDVNFVMANAGCAQWDHFGKTNIARNVTGRVLSIAS